MTQKIIRNCFIGLTVAVLLGLLGWYDVSVYGL
jgi:hypothetical protein